MSLRRHRPGGGRPRRGQALLLALVALTLVSSAVALWGGSLLLRLRTMQETQRRVHLSALLDAAVARGVAELARDRQFTGFAEEAFGPGAISARVEPQGAHARVLTVTARFGAASRRLEARVELGPRGPRVTYWQRLPVEGQP